MTSIERSIATAGMLRMHPATHTRRVTVAVAATLGMALSAAGPAAADPPPSTIAVNGWNSFLVDLDDRLRGAGFTNYQAVGDPTGDAADVLRDLGPLPDGASPVTLGVGSSRVVVVGSNGRVYGSGANFGGQLTDLPETVPPFGELSGLPLDAGAVRVSLTQRCTTVLTDDGRIFRTGGNEDGQCPLAPGAEPALLTEMPGIPAGRVAVDLALGGGGAEFLVVLLDDGTLLGTGNDSEGELPGVTGDQTALVPLAALPFEVAPEAVFADYRNSYVMGSDGQVYGAGANTARQLTGTQADVVPDWQQLAGLPRGVRAADVASGGLTTLVLGDDGQVYATGNVMTFHPEGSLEPGNVGILTPIPRPEGMGPVEEIAANADSYVARGADGRAWGVGRNDDRQLTGHAVEVYGWQVLAGQPSPQRALSLPTVSGRPRAGSVLTAGVGTWRQAVTSYSFQWLRDGTAIAGATQRTHPLGRVDAGHQISVRVTAHSGYPDVAAASQPVAVARQVFNVVRPRIKGTARVGRVLRVASRGTWTESRLTHRFRWLRNGAVIRGATRSSYRLTARDVGTAIRLRVVVTKPGYVGAVATSSNRRVGLTSS